MNLSEITDENLKRKIQDAIRKEDAKNQSSISSAKQKRNGKDALAIQKKIPRFHAPVLLIVRVYKCGSHWDIDNREIKSLIDGLVSIGVLASDTIEEIKRIIKEGHRVETKEEERTEIEIIEM